MTTNDGSDGDAADAESTESGVDTGADAERREVERKESASGDDADGERVAEGGGTEAGGAAEETAESENLRARVAERSPDAIAREIAALRERAEAAEKAAAERAEEVEELETTVKRKQADLQNYKQRTEQRREERAARATEDLVARLLGVRDDLQRAVEQDEDADIRPGVESTLDELDRVLAEEDVSAIEPDPGAEVDPQRHEVLLRTDAEQPAETVAELYRPGYEMAGKVLRPAQVTVSDGT